MSDNPIVPMLVLGGVSYANNWYNNPSTGLTDIKPLLFAGVCAILLEAAAAAGFEKPATLLGWTAVVGMMISPVQSPSPVQNLLSIGQTATKKS